jgi:hypothetical protein
MENESQGRLRVVRGLGTRERCQCRLGASLLKDFERQPTGGGQRRQSMYHAAHLTIASLEVLREFGVSLGRYPRWGMPYFLPNVSRSRGVGSDGRGIRLDRGSDRISPAARTMKPPFHGFRQGHDPQVIRRLLEAGADPNRADRHGTPPLKLAHRTGRKTSPPAENMARAN